MNVIVTGASHGIGRGIASVLAKHGYGVGLLARSADALEELASEIHSGNGACAAAPADLRDYNATEAAVKFLATELGRVDALINNAGLVIRKNIFDISFEEWHAMIDTNVTGAFHATRAVLPFLVEQRSGHIINISSISGKMPLPGGSSYAASKYALTGLSQSMFQEVRDYGIRVTTVYPGSVDSKSHRHDAAADHSWKVQPEEVGEACHDVLRMPAGTCVSELEIRPVNRPAN